MQVKWATTHVPKISIIVPVFNDDQYLGDCLDSILAQHFTDFELILVNDGSTDKTGDICDAYARRDKRIKVTHQLSSGVSAARNTGINLARGNYIGFVDGDDRVSKEMYLTLYNLCEETNSQISVCQLVREINGELMNEGMESHYTKVFSNDQAMEELFKGELYRFSLCNKLFARAYVKHIQFPEGRIHEDLSTTYLLFAQAEQVAYTNQIGYIYVKRNSSILTSIYNEKRLDSFIGWNEILVYINKNYRKLANVVYACFAYWCIDHINYNLFQVVDKQERLIYLKEIRSHLRKHYTKIIKSTCLSRKHKQLITLLCLPSFFINVWHGMHHQSKPLSLTEKSP